jgi:hypothetical protein
MADSKEGSLHEPGVRAVPGCSGQSGRPQGTETGAEELAAGDSGPVEIHGPKSPPVHAPVDTGGDHTGGRSAADVAGAGLGGDIDNPDVSGRGTNLGVVPEPEGRSLGRGRRRTGLPTAAIDAPRPAGAPSRHTSPMRKRGTDRLRRHPRPCT